MQHVAQAIPSLEPAPSIASLPTSNAHAQQTQQTGASLTPTQHQAERAKPSAKLADYVWAHMAGLYGHRWVSAYGDDPRGIGGQEWALTLAGLTRVQIDTGLETCRNAGDDWPPSAPAFKIRCFGIPSFERVRADITTRALGFTRLVWEGLDAWLFANSGQRDAERMLRHAYDYAVARRLDGVELPAEPAGLIEQEIRTPVRASSEVVARYVSEINKMLKAAPLDAANDKKRVAAGDTDDED